MMDACGEAEGRLASELMQHELQLEKDILDPVNHLAEVRGTNTVIIKVSRRGLEGKKKVLVVSLLVSLPGGDSQHNETEKAAGQAGSGLRLGQDQVPSPPDCQGST